MKVKFYKQGDLSESKAAVEMDVLPGAGDYVRVPGKIYGYVQKRLFVLKQVPEVEITLSQNF